MAMPTIVASNQTGGTILLTRLGLTVPSAGTLTLTDYATVSEVREDESLEGSIIAGNMLLNYGEGDLTQGDSLKFFDIQTLETRISVRGMSTTNIASLSGTTTVDTTVVLAINDRVLLQGQTTLNQNGPWVVQAGAWVRPQDFEVGRSSAAAKVFVQEGTLHSGEMWACTSLTGSDVIGTNNLTFAQISGAGGGVSDLQDAYEGGNTIDVTAAEGDLAFTLTSADFTIDGAYDLLIGGGTALAIFNVDAGLMSLDSTDTTNLTMTANDAGDKTLTIAASNAGAGSGYLALTADGEIDLDATNSISLNSTNGDLNIGNNAHTGDINLGSGASVRAIQIGNATGATQVDIDSGTGGTHLDSTGVISLDGVGASNFTTDTGDLTLQTTTSGAVNLSSAGAIDAQAVGNITIDSSGGTLGMGTDANTGAIDIGTGAAARDITIGNKTGATSLTLESGTGNTLIDSPQVTMTGDLVVQGTTTTVESEIVNIADNFLWLNDGYTTTSALEGGIVVNSLPTATADTVAAGGFTAGVGAVSNPTVATTGAATFAAGDFIQISGATDQTNDGLYEVLSHAANVLTVSGIGLTGTTFQFTQNQFDTDATVAGAITKVTIGVVQVDTSGDLQYGYGSTTGISIVDIITASTLSLQSAYDGGNTITTAGGTDVVIAGTDGLQITGAGGLNVDTIADFDVSVFDVAMTAGNGFSITGHNDSVISIDAGVLTFETTTSGYIEIDGTDGVDINSSDSVINIGNDAAAQAINIGTGAAARPITIGNATGATGVTINSGTEMVEVDGVTYYGAGAGLPTATGSGFQDGDKFYDTNLDMEVRYDGTRAKWLSVETMYLHYGREGNQAPGAYYRAAGDGQVMSSTNGWTMPYDGTVVGLGYTRDDADAATFDVVEGGTSRTTLASAAASGKSNALDGNFSADGILAVTNQAGGNTMTDVIGWVKVKFRST